MTTYTGLTDAYEDGTLIDVLNDHTAEAREAGRAAGYEDGYTHGRREGAEAAESAAYAKGYGHGYDDGTDRGYAEAVEALASLLAKRRNQK